ncbi:MAG: hypothetical protein WC371_05785 [Parachlamydiales bacterium]|jgi:hypothetical protein
MNMGTKPVVTGKPPRFLIENNLLPELEIQSTDTLPKTEQTKLPAEKSLPDLKELLKEAPPSIPSVPLPKN